LPLSALIVPTSSGLLIALLVKFVPAWQLPQFFAMKTDRPALPAAVSVPSAFLSGLEAKAFSDFT
jgi:hypothetical protein